MVNKIQKSLIIFFTNKRNLIVIFILLIHIFLRFYEFEKLNPFGWDQLNNSWLAKDVIVDNKYPLLGMVAKGNTGFYIGPAYYYYIVPFYFFTNLDPVASGIIAGVTSIFSFFVLYYIARKLFSYEVAIIALLIHTFSIYIITFDRTQWPVNFVAPISLIIFYTLYKVMQGNAKYLIPLSLALGFSFHSHFTAVFFPFYILLSMPFFKWNKQFLVYIPLSFFIFILWLIPNILSDILNKGNSSKNLTSYINTYYHGLHFTRVIQVSQDAFIEIEAIIQFKILKFFKFLLLPVFSFVYYFQKPSTDRLKLIYLFGIWFMVPWIVFSVYKGEISNYYFSVTRFLAIIAISYLLFFMFSLKYIFLKVVVVAMLLIYITFNIIAFKDYKNIGITHYKNITQEKIKKGESIHFMEGNPESYLYYIYTR